MILNRHIPLLSAHNLIRSELFVGNDLLASRKQSRGLDPLSSNHARDLLLLSLKSFSTLLFLKQPFDKFFLVEVVEVLAALQVLLLVLLLQQIDLLALQNLFQHGILDFTDEMARVGDALFKSEFLVTCLSL